MSFTPSNPGSGAGRQSSVYSLPTEQWKQRMDEKRLDAGLLGKLFGAGASAPNNIAGLAVIAGLAIGAVISGVALYKADVETAAAMEIWKYITPIVTGALGYLFGKGQSGH